MDEMERREHYEYDPSRVIAEEGGVAEDVIVEEEG